MKKHNGHKRPAEQINTGTLGKPTSETIGGHPESKGGSRQGNIGHDKTPDDSSRVVHE